MFSMLTDKRVVPNTLVRDGRGEGTRPYVTRMGPAIPIFSTLQPLRHRHLLVAAAPRRIPHADASARTAAEPCAEFPYHCREQFLPWAVPQEKPGPQIFQLRASHRPQCDR